MSLHYKDSSLKIVSSQFGSISQGGTTGKVMLSLPIQKQIIWPQMSNYSVCFIDNFVQRVV